MPDFLRSRAKGGHEQPPMSFFVIVPVSCLGTALLGIIGGIVFSRRKGMSLLSPAVLLLGITNGFAVATVTLVELYFMGDEGSGGILWIVNLGFGLAGATAGSLIACIVLFVAACATSVMLRIRRARARRDESTSQKSGGEE